MNEKTARLSALCVVLSIISACEEDSAGVLSDASVFVNPNTRAPLVAFVEFDSTGFTQTRLHVSDETRSWEIDFDRVPTDENPLPLLGLRAGRDHDIGISVSVDGKEFQRWGGSLTYTTPHLPEDRYRMPRIEVRESQPGRMEDGVTILSVRRSLMVRPQDRNPGQQKFMTSLGLIIAVDNEGEVVWYYETDERISGIDRLRNGNLIYHMNNFETVELDLLGNRVNSWYAEERPMGAPDNASAIPIKGMQTLHHQPHEVRDGSFLSFSANWKILPDWYTSEYDEAAPRKDQKVMGDTIIEFSKSGDILWSWDAFDYLDPYQIGYEALDPYWVVRGFPDTWDWSHGNGVSYDSRDDSVIASFKLLDAIIKIDRSSKDIKWIFGDHAGWGEQYKPYLLTPVGEDFRWPWHQHNPRWTHAGTLLVFNNNRGQTKPFDGQQPVPFSETYSYSVEYDIDEENGTVEMVWVSEPEMQADSCSSWAMSEAHRLPVTDNILEISAMCHRPETPNVTWDPWNRSMRHVSEVPHGGRVREYTRTEPAEIVFELDFRDPAGVIAWQVFGGFRTPSLYSTERLSGH